MAKSTAAPTTAGPWDSIIERARTIGEGFGLSYHDIDFKPASSDGLSMVASFGLPNRFSHWYFGGIYKTLKTQQDQNVIQILELVLNTDPVYAFLLDSNSVLENTMVIAHVHGHVDFFKNNRWYRASDKGMLDRCERHARFMRKLAEQVGKERLDDVVAAALTIASSVDPFELNPTAAERKLMYFFCDQLPVALRALRKSDPRWAQVSLAAKILPRMRAEMDYFDLIGRTQIINEGWASFVEYRILQEMLPTKEWLDFSLMFSKRPPHYLIGSTLFTSAYRKGGWPLVLKIREHYEDIAFVDEYLTQQLCQELDLFVVNKETNQKEPDVRKVKERIIYEKVFKGQPHVEVDAYDRKTRTVTLKNLEPDRRLERKRTELFMETLHKIWPFEVVLVDGPVTYRQGPQGFTQERK